MNVASGSVIEVLNYELKGPRFYIVHMQSTHTIYTQLTHISTHNPPPHTLSHTTSKVPYSGKLSREKTFANFAVLLLYTKVFSVKFGPWRPLALQKRAICESFLRENRIFTNSRKLSPSKVSRYTVLQTL